MNITVPIIITIIHISILSAFAFILTLIIPFGGLVVSVSAFAYAYFPIPAIAIWSGIFGEKRKITGSIIGLCIGLLFSYILLLIITPDKIDVIGNATIVRHAGASLNQDTDLESYIFPVIVMIAAIKLYWYVLAKESNKINSK
jgi:hypothetical protein